MSVYGSVTLCSTRDGTQHNTSPVEPVVWCEQVTDVWSLIGGNFTLRRLLQDTKPTVKQQHRLDGYNTPAVNVFFGAFDFFYEEDLVL